MKAAHSLYGLLPRWVTERGRRLFRDDRILKKWDNKAHSGYSKRIALLANDK